MKFKEYIEEKAEAGLKKKAEKSGMPLGILRKVYNRGMPHGVQATDQVRLHNNGVWHGSIHS